MEHLGRTKSVLYSEGRSLLAVFCRVNDLTVPGVVESSTPTQFGVCAYYRAGVISVHVAGCAAIGRYGAQWSYPGYVIDRTPYGVIQHELGHHVDVLLGKQKQSYHSEFSTSLRARSREAALTNYCPNDAEWFAEMFRLFVTNPDLLIRLRPRTYDALCRVGLRPCVIGVGWREILAQAPARTIQQTERKISTARTRSGRR